MNPLLAKSSDQLEPGIGQHRSSRIADQRNILTPLQGGESPRDGLVLIVIMERTKRGGDFKVEPGEETTRPSRIFGQYQGDPLENLGSPGREIPERSDRCRHDPQNSPFRSPFCNHPAPLSTGSYIIGTMFGQRRTYIPCSTGTPPGFPLALSALLLCLLCGISGLLTAQDTVDEVLAVVDRNPILASDIALAKLVGVGPEDADRSALLDARIRLELEFLDLVDSGSIHTIDADVSREIDAIVSHCGGEERLSEALVELGLEWNDVEALALRIASVELWIEKNIRPRIGVSVRDVEEAYRRVIVEPIQARGETPPSIEHLNADLRRLVEEEKLNAEIERWLSQTGERHPVTRFVR